MQQEEKGIVGWGMRLNDEELGQRERDLPHLQLLWKGEQGWWLSSLAFLKSREPQWRLREEGGRQKAEAIEQEGAVLSPKTSSHRHRSRPAYPRGAHNPARRARLANEHTMPRL